jgi:glycosyltransferase involved in cell wall biosynthesis
MNKKEIIIDFRMHKSSGIGTYIKNIVPFLIENFKIVLLGNIGELKEYNWFDKIKIINFNTKVYTIKEQLFFPVKTPNSDMFWSPHYNVPFFDLKVQKRIVTIHDIFHIAFLNTLTLPQKIYAKIMMKTAIDKSDIIFTVSEFTKSEILKYYSCKNHKIYIIPNAVDFNIFKMINNESLLKKINRKYYLPKNFILFVGNVKPHKNLKNLLLAYLKLGSSDFQLVIVGKKEGFITGDDTISELLRESEFIRKNVFFTGYVSDEDLVCIYNLASLFVFPSLYEGFGIPPLEAMACGCPCVVSNAASLPEVCGNAAYYVNPYDINDIANGIEKVLADDKLRYELVRKGFENVKRFSWESSAQKVIEILKTL